MKKWKVTAEINMCAERQVSVTVEANTKRKAIQLGLEKIKKEFKNIFFIQHEKAEEISQ